MPQLIQAPKKTVGVLHERVRPRRLFEKRIVRSKIRIVAEVVFALFFGWVIAIRPSRDMLGEGSSSGRRAQRQSRKSNGRQLNCLSVSG
jgi:hypothetical protein